QLQLRIRHTTEACLAVGRWNAPGVERECDPEAFREHGRARSCHRTLSSERSDRRRALRGRRLGRRGLTPARGTLDREERCPFQCPVELWAQRVVSRDTEKRHPGLPGPDVALRHGAAVDGDAEAGNHGVTEEPVSGPDAGMEPNLELSLYALEPVLPHR